MSIKPRRHVRATVRALAAAAAVLAPVAAAYGNVPPSPGLTRSQPVWLGFAFMFLLTAAVVAISLMPSKRSHQD